MSRALLILGIVSEREVAYSGFDFLSELNSLMISQFRIVRDDWQEVSSFLVCRFHPSWLGDGPRAQSDKATVEWTPVSGENMKM